MKKIILFSFLILLASCDIPYDLETRIIFETNVTNSSGNALANIPYIVSVDNGYKYDDISTGKSKEDGTMTGIFPEPDIGDYNISLQISEIDYLPVSIFNFNKINKVDYKISYPTITLYKSDELVDLNITLVNTNPDKQIRKIEFLGIQYQQNIYLNLISNIDNFFVEPNFQVLKNQTSQIKYIVYDYTTATVEENIIPVTISNTDENITITY